MRNSSFFEKLTGSLRLSDEDLSTLSENDSKDKKVKPKSKVTKTEEEYEEVIEEVEDDSFEIPDDEEIETIEEVIEDDSIDHEEIEEYYEEIIDEEDEEENEPKISIYGENDDYDEDVLEENTKDIEEEEVNEQPEEYVEAEKEEEFEKVINVNSSKTIELPIDVFEMHNEVVLRILVPGITPENLKVSITKDRVSLSCTRPAPDGIKDSSYFEREIPYGDFTRMIQLPADVEVEKAEAVEKYGLLIIRLPKLDTKKVQELKIKSV